MTRLIAVASIWAALALSVLGVAAAVFGVRSRNHLLTEGARRIVYINAALLTIANAAMMVQTGMSDLVVATCDYGGPVPAAVEHGHVHAAQFHPEKSSTAGLAFLQNFVDLVVAGRA